MTVRRHLNPEVVWKSDGVHLSGLAVIVGIIKNKVGGIAWIENLQVYREYGK